MDGKEQIESKGIGALRHYFWGVTSATIMLVLGYLIVPMNAKVDENSDKITELDKRVTVLETKISEGFYRIEKKLESIDKKLEEK